jgi:NAD(P)-dependent dehydrogenase (short-subunit alcohol dehydrogenase family)
MATGRTVLITGAGGGLGLEWAARELEEGATVIATARDPESSPGLEALGDARREGTGGAQKRGELLVLRMDVTDDASVQQTRREVERRVSHIDDLVNNAGTYGPRGGAVLEAPPDEVRRVLEVNTIGPYRVTRAFLPLLREGGRSRIIFITSRMGSIGDGPSGSSYAYRMSKSALNMFGANLARDLTGRGILCLLLHPGWVRTRMGGREAPLDIASSVAGMRRVVAAAAPARSGSFFDFEGREIPW